MVPHLSFRWLLGLQLRWHWHGSRAGEMGDEMNEMRPVEYEADYPLNLHLAACGRWAMYDCLFRHAINSRMSEGFSPSTRLSRHQDN